MNGKIVNTKKLSSALAQAKGAMASNAPAVKPLGATPAAPAKTAPKTPAKSAIAPNMSGTKTKNPGDNPGGKFKLGNH